MTEGRGYDSTATHPGWTRATIVLAVLASLAAHATARADRPQTFTHYLFEEAGPFPNLDMYLTWVSAPANDFVFAAQQFFFGDPTLGGYIGLQLQGTDHQALFSIWDSATGSGSATPISPNCVRFDHEGTGTMCPMSYSWILNREYRMRVSQCGTDALGECWSGLVQDSVTLQETEIGRIHVANVGGFTGYGWLSSFAPTFVEYFGPDTGCATFPLNRVSWRGPYVNSGLYTANSADPFYTSCTNSNITSPGKPTVTHEGGGNTTRTTPSGVELWSCSDGIDNDGDGEVDDPGDPGCLTPGDYSEEYACEDSIDNDFDGLADFPTDPGCSGGNKHAEDPQCDDDIDNDNDGKVDWDGGSAGGTPDPNCMGDGWRVSEKGGCGVGFELIFPMILLMHLRRRSSGLTRHGRAPAGR